MEFIRTVLRDILPTELGRTNYHEHAFQVSPLLPGDELDDEAKSTTEFVLLNDSGFDAVVDATPFGLGRQPKALARIAQKTGLEIVMTTGLHRREHYHSDSPVFEVSATALAELFVADLTKGVRAHDSLAAGEPVASTPHGLPIRAGILKAGIGYWSIDPFSHKVIDAVTMAHGATGAPVMVHLEVGTAAHEVLSLLERGGVSPNRVVLAHVDRNPDPGLHADLAARGAFLGYDGAARHRNWPDSMLISCLRQTIERGGGSRIVLGGDVARASRYESYGGMPGLAYVGRRFVPRVADAIGKDALCAVLVDNPRSLLTWR